MTMTMERTDRPDYAGELRSGDFGHDTGHYHAMVEFYSMMIRERGCFATREEAQAEHAHRIGHVAIVGVSYPLSEGCFNASAG